MSTDSSFDDQKPDSVPTTPETDIDPVLDPDSALRDPLARPLVAPGLLPDPQRAMASRMMIRCHCPMIEQG